MSWLPIETAPKDGTRVILWDGEEVRTGGCRWESWYNEWVEAVVPVGYENGVSAVDNPTHWMPLPEPPGNAATKLADANQKEGQG